VGCCQKKAEQPWIQNRGTGIRVQRQEHASIRVTSLHLMLVLTRSSSRIVACWPSIPNPSGKQRHGVETTIRQLPDNDQVDNYLTITIQSTIVVYLTITCECSREVRCE